MHTVKQRSMATESFALHGSLMDQSQAFEIYSINTASLGEALKFPNNN